MSVKDDSLLCPITLELFKDPVLAQDGHTYERKAIVEWIERNGRSPLTNQLLSLEHLYPNYAIKKAIDNFENSMKNKKYQYILNVDVKRKPGRPLFQTSGKSIYIAEWLSINENRPEIVLLKIDGARSQKEASFYVDLSRHPHIVRTYGIVHEENVDDDNNAIMLLQEYALMGSLFDILEERKKPPDEKILIEIFLQITDAMIFLAFNNVVHADLACRNVLVFRFDENDPKSVIVKVTDFGLSRYSRLYSIRPSAKQTVLNIVPIRYVAPEILKRNTTSDDYTEKSDVYSMGVLMWEAYSRCAIPWAKISDDNEVARLVINGERLTRPPNCSEYYWSIIRKTWSNSPEERPTFVELKCLLTEQYIRKTLKSTNISISDIPLDAIWAQNAVTVGGLVVSDSTDNQLCEPHGLFIDADDETILIADYKNHRIIQWKIGDENGQVVGGGNGKGHAYGQLCCPSDVLIDKETDSLIICDRGRVVRWTRHNSFKREEILIDGISCCQLAKHDQKYIYVSCQQEEVRRYEIGTKNFTVVAGGNGRGDNLNQLDWPAYIFVDQQQAVYVSDYYNHRVVKWNKDAREGILIAGGQGEGGALTQLSHPNGLFVDALGTLYIADAGNSRVMRWPKGAKQGIAIVGGSGKGSAANQFRFLRGLSFDRHGNLYVADQFNYRIQRFSILG
ncbi:unnamed protein product [Adineta steineri]|uniref:Non-specific serine/threonine protein kinase n=1 Tax=Adineta steineri TaxID=433720 RepID=A0A819DGW2_9BILA|nr:unnamed protein product [Adineta steineri]CAF3837189.1 unnamed protein product [Adineta steineri]